MDIPQKHRTKYARSLTLVTAVLVCGLLAFGWVRLNAYSSTTFVDHESLVISEVRRGDLVREVRAPGSLVAADLRWVAATSSSRVEKILLDPGEEVTEDTIIMLLSNPDVGQALDSAKLELDVRHAEYRALEQRLYSARLAQESVVTEFKSRLELAQFRKEANYTLAEKNAVSEIDLNESILEEKQLNIRHQIELKRAESLPALHDAELAAMQARIDQSSRRLAFQQQFYDDLTVVANFVGVLQEVPVEQGQEVTKGTVLARVADKDSLKAELRVQESQAKDVRPGQPVMITAGGNSAKGTVRRIEPAVQDGIVIVDVYFDAEPLIGARSELRVDGIIQLERLDNVLTLKRPVFSQENAPVN